jgi:hypothetical protein
MRNQLILLKPQEKIRVSEVHSKNTDPQKDSIQKKSSVQ